MKILFIQLPLNDHSNSYVNGNINYAPAAITAYIKRIKPDVSCEYLPSLISNYCTNNTIIKYIIKLSPDIINFTCFLWNIERNIEIAKYLKKSLPDTTIIFGGAEINIGSIAFQDDNSFVDYFVKGEGEWFYKKLLNDNNFEFKIINNNKFVIQNTDELLNIDEIVEPLSNNYLDIMPDSSVFLELVRGCPYRCSYCLYSNGTQKVRELNPTVLFDVIQSKRNIQEIYILAPTFDKFKNFHEILKALSKINSGINLHTEVRAENFNDELALKMFNAGFKSLEVGLQSLNPRALLTVNRRSNPDKEIDGILSLKKAGIDLKIGIIPGLPDDDPESFFETINRLLDTGLSDSIELYPLMILPGSEIREKAINEGVLFQTKPPYFFLEGWNFKCDDLKKINNYFEEATGFTQSIYSLPEFIFHNDENFIKSIRVDSSSILNFPIYFLFNEIDTHVMDIHLYISDIKDFYTFFHKFASFNKTNRLVNFILYYNDQINELLLSEVIKKYETDSLMKRLNLYNSYKDQIPYRFYQVFDDIVSCNYSVQTYYIISSIYKTSALDDISKLNRISEFSNIIVDDCCYEKNKEFFIGIEDFERLAFLSEKTAEDFYKQNEIEFVDYPINFGSIVL